MTLSEHIDPRAVRSIAQQFHERYERLAPLYHWETQPATRRDWEDLPHENRALMEAVVYDLLEDDIIDPGGRA